MTPISDFNHRPEPRILGAPRISQDSVPQTLDSKTKQAPQGMEVRVHEEHVIASDKVRSDPSGPEVKVRVSDKKAWDKVKRIEDE